MYAHNINNSQFPLNKYEIQTLTLTLVLMDGTQNQVERKLSCINSIIDTIISH
jgi:hypothetical protein